MWFYTITFSKRINKEGRDRMNTLEAIEAMKEGHQVRQNKWQDDEYLEMIFDRKGQPVGFIDQDGCHFSMDITDLKSDKWEIFGIPDFNKKD
jgi:hypothetical protein